MAMFPLRLVIALNAEQKEKMTKVAAKEFKPLAAWIRDVAWQACTKANGHEKPAKPKVYRIDRKYAGYLVAGTATALREWWDENDAVEINGTIYETPDEWPYLTPQTRTELDIRHWLGNGPQAYNHATGKYEPVRRREDYRPDWRGPQESEAERDARVFATLGIAPPVREDGDQ